MGIKTLVQESIPCNVSEFYKEITKLNTLVFKFFLPAIVVFQCINVINVLFFSKSGLGTLNNRIYFTLYVSLMLISIISFVALLSITRNKSYNANKLLNLTFIYVVFFSLWSTFITLMDLQSSENITVYINCMLSISVLIYLKPWQIVPLIAVNHIILLSFFSTFQEVPTNNIGNYINTSIVIVVSISISISKYYTKCVDFNNRHTIMLQNEEITKINDKLNGLVFTDTLSNLYNRRYLDDVLMEKWKEKSLEKSIAAVVMLDIDNFKNYNDYYGHQMGDMCIQSIASIMKTLTNSPNNFAVRYGGEEFTIIMFNTNEREALDLCENIRKKVYALKIENHNAAFKYVSISAGMCLGKIKKNSELCDFIKIADDALYDSKKGGRNKITFVKY